MTKQTNKKDKMIRVYAEQQLHERGYQTFEGPKETFEIQVFDKKTGKSIDFCQTDREDLVAGILFYMQYTYNVHQEDTQWETWRDSSSINRIKENFYK